MVRVGDVSSEREGCTRTNEPTFPSCTRVKLQCQQRTSSGRTTCTRRMWKTRMRGILQRDSYDPLVACGKIIPRGSYRMRNNPRRDRKIESRTRKVTWLPVPYENQSTSISCDTCNLAHHDYFCSKITRYYFYRLLFSSSPLRIKIFQKTVRRIACF